VYVLLVDSHCGHRLVPPGSHTFLGWEEYLCEGAYAGSAGCGARPGEWVRPEAYLLGAWTEAIPTLVETGLLWLLISLGLWLRKLNQHLAFESVVMQSVGKASFYVDSIQKKSLCIHPPHCAFKLVDGYSLCALFWTCRNTWIVLHEFCCQSSVSSCEVQHCPLSPEPKKHWLGCLSWQTACGCVLSLHLFTASPKYL